MCKITTKELKFLSVKVILIFERIRKDEFVQKGEKKILFLDNPTKKAITLANPTLGVCGGFLK